jgi:hypothetical protein
MNRVVAVTQGHFAAITWVTTAFHESQKAHLTGRDSNSDALNPTSPEYLKPLARYEKLHSSDEIASTSDRSDPQHFPFAHHLDVVLRLLEEAGAAPEMIAAALR